MMNHIQTREYQIQFSLKWLSQIQLERALADDVLRLKILKLIQDIHQFTQILPSNPYWPQAQILIKKIHDWDKKTIKHLSYISGDNPEPKSKAYLQNLVLLNQTRIEINTSINLLKYFSQSTEKQPIENAYQVLGFIGVGIPIINLAINAYQSLIKWYVDQKNNQKTQELNYYFEQNQRQIIKTSFIATLNLSNFIASLLDAPSLGIYFNLAALCLEFVFIHINYLETKTKLFNRNLELLTHFKTLAETNTTIDSQYILKKLKDDSTIDQTTRLKMIEFLMNEQQFRSNDYLYYFQFTIFALMLTNIIVLQASGLLDYHSVALISILSAYIYNCIQPYLSNLFLAMTQTQKHEIADGLGQTLVIKHGQLFNTRSLKNQYLQFDMQFGVIAKSILPILIVTLAPTLNPLVALGLILSSHLFITVFEYSLKQFKPEKITQPEKISPPESPSSPPLEMD